MAWLQMMRVSDKMERLSNEHIRCLGMTGAQFDVLAQLSTHEGISQQALSEKLFVTKGNVCGLIGRMEQRDLVKRRPDPNDKRANLLFLTEKGRALAERVMPEQERFVAEQMNALSEQEQTTLRSLLRQLDRSLPDNPLTPTL
ncbi:MAG TPA: MarR family transcriptional regulator [Chloroflexia bacterium]|nr:MarR family transcriptional regulator [Chloroflexia bacterium]